VTTQELAAYVEHDREDARFELLAGAVISAFVFVLMAFGCSPAYAGDTVPLTLPSPVTTYDGCNTTTCRGSICSTTLRYCEPSIWAGLVDAPAPAPKATPRPIGTPAPSPEPIDIQAEPQAFHASDTAMSPEATAESPVLPAPAPSPSPSPGPLTKENARPFHVDTQLGAVVTLTGEAGTDVTPTFWVNADGPLAIGSKRSLGRLGARLGLSSAPGETFDATDIKTYKAMEAGLWLGRVVGKLGEVSTTVIVEGTFATRMKGSNDPEPLKRTVRSLGAGLRFDARRSNASLATLVAYDEATASCDKSVDCTGIHSGLAFIVYGQVPIAQGAVLFTGDASLAAGRSVSWLRRRDVVRVGIVVDPVQTVKVIRGR
jgi:hypothetical protein